MISLPRKDLHGLTGLRISVSPATEPAWMQHCSDPLALVFPCQLCLECIWPAELCLCHNHAAQSGGSGQNPGSPPFCLFRQPKQMHEWAFINMRPCLCPAGWLWSPYAQQHIQLSWSRAPGSLHIFCTSTAFGVVTMSPTFLCFVGCERNPVLLCSRLAAQPAEQAGLCRLPAVSLTLCCPASHHVVSLPWTNSAEMLCSVRNPAHHIPAFPFPPYSCFFGMEGFLGVNCQITAESCDLWHGSLEAKGVWGVAAQLLYCIIPANPPVFFRPLCTVTALETQG